MIGTIYKSTGSWYWLKAENNVIYSARLKGKFKNDSTIKSSNPIAVGDKVLFDIEDNDKNQVIIKDICARQNYIVRESPQNRHNKHIIASNIDQSLLIITITQPNTPLGFIDRFLVTSEVYHIPSIIVINKIDLLIDDALEQLKKWKKMYEDIGYKVLTVSTLQPKTLEPLKILLTNKTTLLSGHSGVGKSTIINLLNSQLSLRTDNISNYSGKGQHTTTFAEMFDLPDGGSVIDTPGLKEFGLIDINKDELSHYFKEMNRLLSQCRFSNCQHINEPNCAIKSAVDEGVIYKERYFNYYLMRESLTNKH